jgi:hypothetical protein
MVVGVVQDGAKEMWSLVRDGLAKEPIVREGLRGKGLTLASCRADSFGALALGRLPV